MLISWLLNQDLVRILLHKGDCFSSILEVVACATMGWLTEHVLDSGSLSRESALPPDRGGKPGGVTGQTLPGAVSLAW
jgi:hypothetical protein